MSENLYPAPPPRRKRPITAVTLYEPDGTVTTRTDAAPAAARSHTTIKELPSDDRPREKLVHLGAGALSEAELLAILLRVGSQGETAIDLARRLLREFGGITGLSRASVSTLCTVHGLGEAKACQLLAAL